MHAPFTLSKNFLLTQTVKQLELFGNTRKGGTRMPFVTSSHHELMLDYTECLKGQLAREHDHVNQNLQTC